MTYKNLDKGHYKSFAHSVESLWLTTRYQSLSIQLAYWAGKNRLTPNFLTAVSGLLVVLAMVVLLVFGFGSWLVAGAVFILLSSGYLLDCADGQLARASDQCSKYGAWLDHVSDAGKIFVVHGCVGWLLLESLDAHGYSGRCCFLAVLLNMAGTSLYFFAWNYKVMIAGDGLIARLADRRAQQRINLLRSLQQSTDYGWFLFLFILLFDPQKFALAYFIYGAGTFVLFMAYIVISARYMAKLND